MKRIHSVALALMMSVASAAPVAAQDQAYDPSSKLREVLPAEIADQVIATIAASRSRGLPTQALERTALKGAARQVAPSAIQAAVAAQAALLDQSRQALAPMGRAAADEEIEAGAEALRRGVDGTAVSELATSTPSGRSLAVPLYVLGTLVERGLPSDDALAAVVAKLSNRATDAQIAELPAQAAAGGKPSTTGRELAGTRRAGAAGRPPVAVPANAGAGAKPTVPTPTRPVPRP